MYTSVSSIYTIYMRLYYVVYSGRSEVALYYIWCSNHLVTQVLFSSSSHTGCIYLFEPSPLPLNIYDLLM